MTFKNCLKTVHAISCSHVHEICVSHSTTHLFVYGLSSPIGPHFFNRNSGKDVENVVLPKAIEGVKMDSEAAEVEESEGKEAEQVG